MRNLHEYVNICKAELDSIGIKYGNIIDVKVNTRAKRRWGSARECPEDIPLTSMPFS